jgi:hypothetical protein
MLLVQGRGETAGLPAVVAVLLHNNVMDTWTACSVISTGKGEMAVLPAVTAVLLHHSAMDTWTVCSVISTGKRGNIGSACSYCTTVTSQCYGYMDLP